MKQPTPTEVAEAARKAEHTPKQAGAVVYVTARAWQYYESGERKMSAGLYELYRLKTGQIKLEDVK